MDHRAMLDHQFRVIAFGVTWVIQLAYLGWLGFKRYAQRRQAEQFKRTS